MDVRTSPFLKLAIKLTKKIGLRSIPGQTEATAGEK
jgi:hypothetical protein